MDYSFVHRIHLYKQYITEHYSKKCTNQKIIFPAILLYLYAFPCYFHVNNKKH